MADDLVQLTVRIPRSLWKRTKLRAVEEERDLRDVVMESLERYLGEKLKKGGARGAR
jgi:hypothetical protein